MSNVPASVLNPQIRNLLVNRVSRGVFADSSLKGNPFRQILPVAGQPAQLDQKRQIVGFLRLPFNAETNEPRILSKNAAIAQPASRPPGVKFPNPQHIPRTKTPSNNHHDFAAFRTS
jgi:hypothetical protein